MSFNGNFEHKLDSKGRIVVPSCFRGELGEHIVITSMEKKCVSAYSEKNWQSVVDRIEANALKSSSGSDLMRIVMSISFAIDVDSTGRILLPEKMRSDVGIVQDVFIVGNNKKIEIWDSENWHKYKKESDGLLSELNDLLPGL
ncbi:MAG: division/cell wall cluster transcriptional repressor MraZ [Synergistaceae bacterium]|jgi:MraZ protein|nr:division/cell wall cluster transcriptional repressor MraZ [Synergistaceae bacterium]